MSEKMSKKQIEYYSGVWIDRRRNELFRAENNPDYPHSFWQKLLTPIEAMEMVEQYGYTIDE